MQASTAITMKHFVTNDTKNVVIYEMGLQLDWKKGGVVLKLIFGYAVSKTTMPSARLDRFHYLSCLVYLKEAEAKANIKNYSYRLKDGRIIE